jgi:hypothetical protein
MLARLLLPLVLTLLAAAAPLPLEFSDPTANEGWVRQQVQAGRPADLNERCGTPKLDTHDTEDVRWHDGCRHIRPAFLAALLTRAGAPDDASVPVILRGAYLDGVLDLEAAHIRGSQTAMQDCWLTGDLLISDTKFDGPLDLSGTLVGGQLTSSYAFIEGRLLLIGAILKKGIEAPSMHVGSSAFLRGTQIGGAVMLRDARIDGQIDMEGSTIAAGGPFDAQRLSVGPGGLHMRNVAFGGPVDLGHADIEGEVVAEAAIVPEGQTFSAQTLHTHHGSLFLRNMTFGGPVMLNDIDVGGQVALTRSHIAPRQNLNAQRLHAGAGGLDAQEAVFGGGVDFNSARIGDQLDISGMKLAAESHFSAERMQVAGALLARDVTFGKVVDLQALSVDGVLDLRGSHLRELSLEDSDIKADLVFGGRISDNEKWVHWEPCDADAPCLNLRNVRVVNLQDDERAWPAHIKLEGFTYTHLGGAGGDRRQDMRNRPVTWWHDWLQRDPVYSTQPYTQLASVLTAAGDRDAASEIRFYSRDRQRSELLRGCGWLQSFGLVERPDDARPCGPANLASWFGLSVLQVFVGYGIGNYSFRAVGWALIFALIGTAILCSAPGVRGVLPVRFIGIATRGPRQKSLLWCFGASLNRVLPLVTISQEFDEFFNDPKRERLHAWQHVAFGVLALCGWAVGLFVVAAFSGLIQN